MKTEHDLNKFITRKLKAREDLLFLKASEKYVAGVSDFLIWSHGRGMAVETKFIKSPPTKGKLLSHPFSSKQISFLKNFNKKGGCKAYGLIGVGSQKLLYPVMWYEIPESGNWDAKTFFSWHERMNATFDEVGCLISNMYSGYLEDLYHGRKAG